MTVVNTSAARDYAEATEPAEDLRPLIAGCEPELRRRALAMTGSEADAEDLVQDTIERALRSLSRFQRGTSMRLWLLTIMKNLFFDSCRAAAVRRRAVNGASVDVATQSAPPPDAEPEPVPLWAQISVDEFQTAVGRLDELSREVFCLRATEHLAYGEIAERLSVPMATVGTRLFRSRSKLRRMLMDVVRAKAPCRKGQRATDL